MSELPDEFPCTITDWEYIYGLCREVADGVREAEYEPETVVALARGGWFAGRCLCDFLGLNDLASLKIEHYVGTAETGEGPQVRYPMPEGSVEGKDVLIVDDIADTGKSLKRAHDYVTDRNPSGVRTATLQLMQESEFEPDFVGHRMERWAWVVYPWNFVEDMIDLIGGVMEKEGGGTFTESEVRRLLYDYHEIERIELEVAQPNRIEEILGEMDRREIVVDAGEDGWRYTGD